MYATIAQARDAGATGSDAEITAALELARDLIDAYTGRWWEPTAATIVTRVSADGMALLPYRVREVTAVAAVGSDVTYPESAYIVTSSDMPGQFDSVRLGARSWADPLVAGAEPWSGGWASLFSSTLGASQVAVTGTFGAETTPAVVVDAAAALAAWRTGGGSLVPAEGGDATPPSTDDEGNAVSITIDATAPITTSRTTGVAAVDAALAPHVRSSVLIG